MLTFHALGGWKPSPLGEAFRRLAVRFRGEHVSEVIAHSLFTALSFRIYHEVPQAGAGGDVALRVRELIREICRSNDIEIVRGHVSGDHVHLLLSVPPSLAPSRVQSPIKALAFRRGSFT